MKVTLDSSGKISCILKQEELIYNGFVVENLDKNPEMVQGILRYILKSIVNNAGVGIHSILSPVNMTVLLDDSLRVDIPVVIAQDNYIDDSDEETCSSSDDFDLFVVLQSLDDAIALSSDIDTDIVFSSDLYKYKDTYYLYVILTDKGVNYVDNLCNLMLEYAIDGSMVEKEFLKEHGQLIVSTNAIDILQNL